MKVSRRKLMQAAGVAALVPPDASAAETMPPNKFEGPATPKICLSLGDGGGGRGGAAAAPASPGALPALSQEEAARRIKQLSVKWVLSNGGPIPWEESRLKEQAERFKSYGVTLGNLMITGFNNAIYARPGRDEEIEMVIASIQAAGIRPGISIYRPSILHCVLTGEGSHACAAVDNRISWRCPAIGGVGIAVEG